MHTLFRVLFELIAAPFEVYALHILAMVCYGVYSLVRKGFRNGV